VPIESGAPVHGLMESSSHRSRLTTPLRDIFRCDTINESQVRLADFHNVEVISFVNQPIEDDRGNGH